MLVMEGPAGIGKTEPLRLALAMAAELELGAVQATGGELERNDACRRREPAEQD